MNRRTRSVLLALVVALGLTITASSPALAHSGTSRRTEVTRGSFVTLPGGTAKGYTVRGHAVMLRIGDRTAVVVHVRGLDPRTTYPAHVHNAPCSDPTPGGSHYQHVVGGPVDAVNEIWPTVTTGPSGVGLGFATHANRARAEAMSIVIHYPPDTSVRLACMDLT